MLNGAFVIEMVYISFSEIKVISLVKARTILVVWWIEERLIEKKLETWAVKNIFPLDFAKYLSYSEVQKKRKVVNI